VADSIAANEALLARLEASTASSSQPSAGDVRMDLDITGLLRMRLSEHAVHSWDVAVTIDPSAEVTADAARAPDPDGLPTCQHEPASQPTGIEPIAVSTTTPERHFLLVPEGVRLERASDGAPTRWNCPPRRFSDSSTGAPRRVTPRPRRRPHLRRHVDELRSLFPGVLSPGSVRRHDRHAPRS